MGSFYVNTCFVGADLDSVLAAVPGPAFAFAEGDCVSVFARADEVESTAALGGLTAALSCPSLRVSVYDSDILSYEVYDHGVAGPSGSVPDQNEYFGMDEMLADADPELLAAVGAPTDRSPTSIPDGRALVEALGRGDGDRADAVLRGDHVFAEDRHLALLEALGLPTAMVGWGYRYLEQDRASYDGPELVVVDDVAPAAADDDSPHRTRHAIHPTWIEFFSKYKDDDA